MVRKATSQEEETNPDLYVKAPPLITWLALLSEKVSVFDESNDTFACSWYYLKGGAAVCDNRSSRFISDTFSFDFENYGSNGATDLRTDDENELRAHVMSYLRERADAV